MYNNKNTKGKYSGKSNGNSRSGKSQGSSTNNSRYRGKSSKSRTYNNDKDAETNSERVDSKVNSYVGSTNDPAWYNKNTRLIADVTKIPFSNQLGAPLHGNTQQVINNSGQITTFSVPGIAAIQMLNIPGIATRSSDGVNLAATGLFQFIRKNLSTTASYAAADVMMYVLGIDDIYSQYTNIARLFGIVNAYSAYNLYMPKALIFQGYAINEAEYQNIVANLNSYRSRFNNLILKASTLYLPTDFTITRRHAWLYSNYFVDGESAKSQIYIHRMMGHYELDETTYDTGTALCWYDNQNTLTYLLDDFEDCIDAYRSSDSMLRIAADMRRAFENRSAWTLAYIDESYLTLPMYDKNVLSQITNLNVYPSDAFFKLRSSTVAHEANSLDIVQNVDKNTISFDPQVKWLKADEDEEAVIKLVRSFVPLISDQMLNFHTMEVTSDDILEATRNTIVASRAETGSGELIEVAYRLLQTGVDMCVRVSYLQLMPSGEYGTVSIDSSTVDTSHPNLTNMISSWSMFDWAPKMWMNKQTYESSAPMDLLPISDLENYTSVNRLLISQMNDNILTSMWMVPELGNYAL